MRANICEYMRTHARAYRGVCHIQWQLIDHIYLTHYDRLCPTLFKLKVHQHECERVCLRLGYRGTRSPHTHTPAHTHARARIRNCGIAQCFVFISAIFVERDQYLEPSFDIVQIDITKIKSFFKKKKTIEIMPNHSIERDT